MKHDHKLFFIINPFLRSLEVEIENENIENVIKMSVFFPDATLPHASNGGFDSQTRFREAVVKKDLSTFHSEIHCRPSERRLKDYEGENLADAFPLQFPYGISNLPKKVDAGAKRRKGFSLKKCIMLFLSLAIPAMHTAEFILVCHNIIVRETAVNTAYLRCQDRIHGDSAAVKYSQLSQETMEAACAMEQSKDGRRIPGVPGHFIRTLRATCGSMAHSNEAARKARSNFFSLHMRFGLPSVMFTITPDDAYSLRIQMMSTNEWVRKIRVEEHI